MYGAPQQQSLAWAPQQQSPPNYSGSPSLPPLLHSLTPVGSSVWESRYANRFLKQMDLAAPPARLQPSIDSVPSTPWMPNPIYSTPQPSSRSPILAGGVAGGRAALEALPASTWFQGLVPSYQPAARASSQHPLAPLAPGTTHRSLAAHTDHRLLRREQWQQGNNRFCGRRHRTGCHSCERHRPGRSRNALERRSTASQSQQAEYCLAARHTRCY